MGAIYKLGHGANGKGETDPGSGQGFRTSVTYPGLDSFAKPLETSRATIEDIYPAQDILSPELPTALKLLDEALGYIHEAILASEQEKLVQADDATQHTQALLPELFCCRRIGEGFAAIVNAADQSLQNLTDGPANSSQLHAIRNAFTQLRNEPFMSFTESTKYLDEMVATGLKIEPAGMEILADFFDG